MRLSGLAWRAPAAERAAGYADRMQRMLRSSTLAGTILVVATLALAGCASGAGGEPADPVGSWGDTATRSEPSLVLADDGILTGTDGCNRLRGGWSADGQTITFEQVASTRMACPDVDTWLSGLATATVDGQTLTILDASGAELGTLERSRYLSSPAAEEPAPADPATFVGTWGTASTDTAPGEPFIVIAEDGTASGSDGCNSFGGVSWKVDGTGLVFDGGYQSLMACEHVDQWLNQRATATLDGDTMVFFDESGAEIGALPRTE